MPMWLKVALARMEAGTSGYLEQVGWFRTRAERVARDASGSPIPWFTYPAIAFLDDRVSTDWRVLEFGAGMGTQWWCARAGAVTAVEHDPAWADEVARQCGARILRSGAAESREYVGPALDGTRYNIVVVDGIFRNECLNAAPDLLDTAGVIILDDAQREEYLEGKTALRNRGFRVVEFHGPQPVSKHAGCTAFYYREDNILGL